jgi:adenine phosphoribosyltransferase
MILKYNGEKEYILEVAGVQRKLPIIEIENDKLWIASFVMLGDSELNQKCAQKLHEIITAPIDYIIVPEAKSVPLAQSLSEKYLQAGKRLDYIVLRKNLKSYMQNPLISEVQSITTRGRQMLILDGKDAERINGKKILALDDVISTGSSFNSMTKLIKKAGGQISEAWAVLREGDFDLTNLEKNMGVKVKFLSYLPLFKK